MSADIRRRLTGLRAGFTLIEMLVATALTVFLMAIFTTLLVSASKSVRTMRGIGEIDQKVRNVTTLMRADLDHLYLGPGVRLSRLFQDVVNQPAPPVEGYFTIEENSPASTYLLPGDWPDDGTAETKLTSVGLNYRQGVDQAGVPVEIDTDDVLALTVAFPSPTRADQIFYGRVPLNSVLDDELVPLSRFDIAGNSVFTSPLAEVIYFLRPSGRQHLLTAEINNPSNLQTNTAGDTPVAPATYTLYRRQLLVLTSAQKTLLETNGVTPQTEMQRLNLPRPVAPGELDSPSYYQHFDVSAYWDATLPTPTLLFADMQALSLRQNRYGMIRLNGVAAALHDQRELPFLPALYPDGYHQTNPDLDPTTPDDQAWFGRPTLAESAHHSFPVQPPNPPAVPAVLNNTSYADNNNNGVIDAYDPNDPATGVTPAQRAKLRQGEDILLTNVVSLDIKVLDDDFVYLSADAGDDADWPGVRTNTTALNLDPPATHAVNPAIKTDDAWYSTVQNTEFIDLGYWVRSYRRESNTTHPFDYNPIDPDPTMRVFFGEHAPARWRTPGRSGETAGGQANFGPPGTAPSAADAHPVSTYDTWSNQYGGVDVGGIPPTGGGFDKDSGNGRWPPYMRPLRAVQIKLRVLEPKTGIVREFAIIHWFE